MMSSVGRPGRVAESAGGDEEIDSAAELTAGTHEGCVPENIMQVVALSGFRTLKWMIVVILVD